MINHDPFFDIEVDDDVAENQASYMKSIEDEAETYVKPSNVDITDHCFTSDVKLFLIMQREFAKVDVKVSPNILGSSGLSFSQLGLIGGAPDDEDKSSEFEGLKIPRVIADIAIPGPGFRPAAIRSLRTEISALEDEVCSNFGLAKLDNAKDYFENKVKPKWDNLVSRARFKSDEKKLIIILTVQAKWLSEYLISKLGANLEATHNRSLSDETNLRIKGPSTLSSLFGMLFSEDPAFIAHCKLNLLSESEDTLSGGRDNQAIYKLFLRICKACAFTPQELIGFSVNIGGLKGKTTVGCVCGSSGQTLARWVIHECRFEKWMCRIGLASNVNGRLSVSARVDWDEIIDDENHRLKFHQTSGLDVSTLGIVRRVTLSKPSTSS